jgi:hypothetical protein
VFQRYMNTLAHFGTSPWLNLAITTFTRFPSARSWLRAAARILPVAAGLAVLAASMGCIYIHESSFSSSELRAVTHRTNTGEMPAGVDSVDIENRHGEVHILGVDPGATGWTWQLEMRARSDEVAAELADTAALKPIQEGHRLRLILSLPDRSDHFSFRSDLDVRVPKSVAVHCRNSHGAVRLAEVSGNAVIVNQHGEVQLRDLPGSVSAQTSFASLTARQTGPATLKSHHGSITADQVHGPVNAETTFAVLSVSGIQGDAVLANQHGSIHGHGIAGSAQARTSFASLDVTAAGPSLTCENQHGSIRIRALSAGLATLSATTSFASMEVRLPAASNPAVRARTSFAEIDSDFPVIMKPHAADAQIPSGTPRVRLQNQHGAIRVLRD